MNSNQTVKETVLAIHIVAGPTAGGKSAYALDLARKMNGVIINCDSMQIFDGLPILTAQPSEEDQALVPHKLYSALDPGEPCSAGIWQSLALAEIRQAQDREQTPIICGGTGLYIKALMEGLSPIPDIPPQVREAAVQKQKELGNPGFYEELKKRDPVTAARFHPHHTARLIRAWEVLAATGRTLTDWQAESKNAPPKNWHFEIYKIMPGREELYRRCNERFLKMLDQGALEEVEDFSARIDKGEIPEKTLLTRALGFGPLRDFIKGGISRDKAIERAQAQTRQYAKRQTTWFRHQL